MGFPAFCKNYSEYFEIQKLIRTINKKHAELLKASSKDIQQNSLKSDELIAELLDKSTDIELTDKIYAAALIRFRIGNPPGKKKVTIGDEINWESLLIGTPNHQDLYFVSGDSDYASTVNPDSINAFLNTEWKEKKKSSIHFYKTITEFFKKNYPDIKLATDIKINKLIEQLAASWSFATTHSVIADLSKQTEFSKAQVEEIINVLDHNSQVYWILGDTDVNEFYATIYEKYYTTISEEAKENLKGKLFPSAGTPDHDDDDIPF